MGPKLRYPAVYMHVHIHALFLHPCVSAFGRGACSHVALLICVTVFLRGHNGKVTSFTWLHNDTCIVSVGVDGAVYQWNVLVRILQS
jgi:hypothetical protein